MAPATQSRTGRLAVNCLVAPDDSCLKVWSVMVKSGDSSGDATRLQRALTARGREESRRSSTARIRVGGRSSVTAILWTARLGFRQRATAAANQPRTNMHRWRKKPRRFVTARGERDAVETGPTLSLYFKRVVGHERSRDGSLQVT
eukprot:685466-Prymnesium_polylepis.1